MKVNMKIMAWGRFGELKVVGKIKSKVEDSGCRYSIGER